MDKKLTTANVDELERHAIAYAEAKCGITNNPSAVRVMERAEDAVMARALSLIAAYRALSRIGQRIGGKPEADPDEVLAMVTGHCDEYIRLEGEANAIRDERDALAAELRKAKADGEAMREAIQTALNACPLVDPTCSTEAQASSERECGELDASWTITRILRPALQPHPGTTIADENQRLREAERWIPVSERLPEVPKGMRLRDLGNVLTYRANAYPPYMQIGWGGEGGGCANEYEVTHWRPLPAAPELATGGEVRP